MCRLMISLLPFLLFAVVTCESRAQERSRQLMFVACEKLPIRADNVVVLVQQIDAKGLSSGRDFEGFAFVRRSRPSRTEKVEAIIKIFLDASLVAVSQEVSPDQLSTRFLSRDGSVSNITGVIHKRDGILYFNSKEGGGVFFAYPFDSNESARFSIKARDRYLDGEFSCASPGTYNYKDVR